jgi:hypothetical protein
MLLTKGSTPFIILMFWTRKSKLNLGVILTIILPFAERETVEITNPLIPLKRKVELSKLRTDIAEKELACSIRASRKVHFLERALALVSRVLLILVSRALEPLVSRALGPLFPPWFLDLVCDTKVQSLSVCSGSWVAILAQLGFPEVVLAWVAKVASLAWVAC